MSTSYIGSTFAESDSVSIPSHQAGDLMICFATRSSPTTIAIPSGWFLLTYTNVTARILAVAWKIAASTSEVSGTWTNAELMGVGVWRHTTDYLIPQGRLSQTGTNATTVVYPPINSGANRQSGSSWVAGMCAVPINSSSAEVAPSGMTNRGSLAGTSSMELALHDTNADTSWASNQSVGLDIAPATTAYVSYVVELFASGIPKASSGGGIARLINGGLVRGQVQ